MIEPDSGRFRSNNTIVSTMAHLPSGATVRTKSMISLVTACSTSGLAGQVAARDAKKHSR